MITISLPPTRLFFLPHCPHGNLATLSRHIHSHGTLAQSSLALQRISCAIYNTHHKYPHLDRRHCFLHITCVTRKAALAVPRTIFPKSMFGVQFPRKVSFVFAKYPWRLICLPPFERLIIFFHLHVLALLCMDWRLMGFLFWQEN